MSTFQNVKNEILKYPWEHFPCVRSGHMAIHGKNRGLGWICRIFPYIFIYKLPINHRDVEATLAMIVVWAGDTIVAKSNTPKRETQRRPIDTTKSTKIDEKSTLAPHEVPRRARGGYPTKKYPKSTTKRPRRCLNETTKHKKHSQSQTRNMNL